MIFDFLDRNGISYQLHEHPAVFTCEQVKALGLNMPGAETKNLFLRDGKGKRHFIVMVRPECTVDLKQLGKTLGLSGLGFGSAERLKAMLGVEPGSVTVLGVVNDTARSVEVIIEAELWRHERFQCHPLVNTATVVLSKADLENVLALTAHTPTIMEIPQRSA